MAADGQQTTNGEGNFGSKKRTATFQTLTTKRLKHVRNVTKLNDGCEIIIDISKKGRCQFKFIQENGHDGAPSQSICRDLPTLTSDPGCGSDSGPTCSGNDKLNRADDGGSNNARNDCRGLGFPPLTQYVALDCEFVGVRNDQSALGRCSIVDHEGGVLCDVYVQPEEAITTYRTRWSGITKKHMENAIPHEFALSKISAILEGKIVVGHDLFGDFSVLGMRPLREYIRDTSTFPGLRGGGGQKMSLKRLALQYLGLHIQAGSHCSVQDSQTAMSLYRLVRHEWETSLLKQAKHVNQSEDPSNQSGPSSQNQSTSGEGNSDTPNNLSPSNSISANDTVSRCECCLGNGCGKFSVASDGEECSQTNIPMSLSSDNLQKPASCNNMISNSLNVKRSNATDEICKYWEISHKEKLNSKIAVQGDSKAGINKEMEKEVIDISDKVTGMRRNKSDSCLVLKSGKVAKKKSKKKKKNKIHFGQINIGNHSVNEYFKAGNKTSIVTMNEQSTSKNDLSDGVLGSYNKFDKDQSKDMQEKSRTLKLNKSVAGKVTYNSTAVNRLYNDEFWPDLNQDS